MLFSFEKIKRKRFRLAEIFVIHLFLMLNLNKIRKLSFENIINHAKTTTSKAQKYICIYTKCMNMYLVYETLPC